MNVKECNVPLGHVDWCYFYPWHTHKTNTIYSGFPRICPDRSDVIQDMMVTAHCKNARCWCIGTSEPGRELKYANPDLSTPPKKQVLRMDRHCLQRVWHLTLANRMAVVRCGPEDGATLRYGCGLLISQPMFVCGHPLFTMMLKPDSHMGDVGAYNARNKLWSGCPILKPQTKFSVWPSTVYKGCGKVAIVATRVAMPWMPQHEVNLRSGCQILNRQESFPDFDLRGLQCFWKLTLVHLMDWGALTSIIWCSMEVWVPNA